MRKLTLLLLLIHVHFYKKLSIKVIFMFLCLLLLRFIVFLNGFWFGAQVQKHMCFFNIFQAWEPDFVNIYGAQGPGTQILLIFTCAGVFWQAWEAYFVICLLAGLGSRFC